MDKYKIGDHIKLDIPTLSALKGYTRIDVLANSICTITGTSSCFSDTVDKVVPTYKIKEYDHWIPEEGIAGIVYESNGTPRYKVGDKVLVWLRSEKKYDMMILDTHLVFNNKIHMICNVEKFPDHNSKGYHYS